MTNKTDKSKTKDAEKSDDQNLIIPRSNMLQEATHIVLQDFPASSEQEILERAVTHSNNVSPVENALTSIDVSFSVDAGIIDRLGRELVSKKETAVSELIKNAYDADAVNVRLIFIEADTEIGELQIEDDGSGMTLEDLINGFMRISSSDKATYPHSPIYQRRRAGQKGIGRFATQRLGHILEITTQTEKDSYAHKVTINWDDYKDGLDLSKIQNRLEQVPKRAVRGTLINIRKLREYWNSAMIHTIYKDVSDLILPSFIFDQDLKTDNLLIGGERLTLKKASGSVEPGFDLIVKRRSGLTEEIVSDAQTQLFEKTLGVISGHVDKNGNGFWSLESSKLGINEAEVPIGPDREKVTAYQFLKDVSLRTHYFHTNSKIIPRTDESILKKFFGEKGGVRLYRNGFKVRPYGESGDDWLALDYSTRRRKFLFPHANDNFYGWVEVSEKLFEETSSREYLIENEAFKELQEFARNVLITAASRLAAARGKKISSSQKDWTATNKLPDLVKEIRSRLSEAISYARVAAKNQDDEIPEPFLLLLTTAEAVDKDLARLRGTQEKLLEEQGMLRVLASLGLIIGEFTHEIKHTLGASALLTEQLIDQLPSHSEELQTAEDLQFNIGRFKTYAAYFGRAIADNASRELMSRDLQEVVADFVETVSHAAKNSGITINLNLPADKNLLTVPMHASELASILFNLFSNAQKAIIRAGVGGKVLISLASIKDTLLLDFCDNGDGISAENRDLIFEAFYTTTRSASVSDTDEELLQGAGLGLKIVKDILQSYQGNIYLADPPEGYVTCFRCEIPSAIETAE